MTTERVGVLQQDPATKSPTAFDMSTLRVGQSVTFVARNREVYTVVKAHHSPTNPLAGFVVVSSPRHHIGEGIHPVNMTVAGMLQVGRVFDFGKGQKTEVVLMILSVPR